MSREHFILFSVIGGFVAVAVVVVLFHGLPEEGARDFNALSQVSIKSDMVILKNATSGDDTYVYAINDAAAQAVRIAENDSQVMKILDESRGSTVTIVGVQPTVMESNNGNEMQGSSGEVVITSNRQSIAGQPYTQPDDFSGIAGKPAEAHQQVWNVLIDMDSKKVVDIQTDQQRVIYGTIQENSVITGMNMFMPDQAKVPPGTQVTWNNNSKLEHNVVGVFKTDSGKNIAIDSGFIPPGRSWSYTFQDAGLFDYQCTIHSQEGMKGAIIVTSA